MYRILALFLLLAPSTYASAPDEADAGLTASVGVGGGFGLGELGTSFVPRVEVGFLLPPLERVFELVLSLDWSKPRTSGETRADERLPGDGSASWEATHDALGLGLGVRARVPLDGIFRPNVMAGVRFHFYESTTSGDASGAPFGENTVQGTAVGLTLGVGGELYVGPGALLLDVVFVYVPLDDLVFTDSSTIAIDALIGYRFFF